MTVRSKGSGRAALAVPIGLAFVLGAYAGLGPAGMVTVAVADLPLPNAVTNESGGAVAAFDAGAWVDAFHVAGLPAWSLDPPIEHAPAVRAIELTRPWTQEADAEALGQVAQQLVAIGRLEAAFDYAILAAELGANEAKWRYWVGLIAQRHGQAGAAIAALERAAELDPDYGVTHARLGALFFERDQLDAADAAYERASQREPGGSLGLRGRAEIALRRGDAVTAMELIDSSIQKAPGDFRSHRIRAQVLSALGRREESLAAVEHASQLPVYRGWTTFDPRLAEVIASSGTLQSLEMKLSMALQTGDLVAAADAGGELLKRRPNSISILISMASIEANRGRKEQALELSTRAVELEPSNVEYLSLHCEVAISARAAEVVEEATTRLLALDRRRAASWALRARGLYVTSRTPQAVQAMERAMGLEPLNPAHPLLLSQILEGAGRREQAVEALRDAVVRMPSAVRLKERLRALGAK